MAVEVGGRRRGRPPKSEVEEVSKRKWVCKAHNDSCGLERGESLALGAIGVMPCDICCSESKFCRECSCILCGGKMDSGPAAYTSVRCYARMQTSEFCGHGAHLACALECDLAGVVESLGLHMEYICRRCDRKTDLREIIVHLLESLRYTNSRILVEENLDIALNIMKGSMDGGAKRLSSLVESAIQMMKKGSDIVAVYNVLHGTGPVAVFD